MVAIAPDSTPDVTPAGYYDCPAGYLCAWVDTDYRGRMGQWSGNNRHWSAFSNSTCQTGSWNDCASSARNNGRYCDVLMYEHAGYGGTPWLLWRGEGQSNLGRRGANDKISSNSWSC
ncbi:peptidase inhibitor family I36 protein [Actinopolymorpha alba]|uniref:peptidase inhibitor family I36 protein n=1 Tax=Actinopolymorpha alba TaxID=533267 RepID=UPI003B507458